MKQIKDVTLAFCCKENWNSFSSIDERTRLCGTCKHNVVDFTNASQADFQKAMQSESGVCGRFKRSQISDSFLKLAAASLMAASVASIGCDGENRVKPKTPRVLSSQIHSTISPDPIVMGIPKPPDSLHIVPKIIPDVLIKEREEVKGD